MQFWTPDSLRGYGCGTPNGTLWTICVIIQFYIISWFIYKIFHNKRLLTWILGFIAVVFISVIGQVVFDSIGIETLSKLYDQTIVKWCWMFYSGCFFAEFKEKLVLPVFSRFWYLFIIIAIIPYYTQFDIVAGYRVLHSILLVIGLIGFAYKYPRLALKVDISYSIFLYHMIVVNVFISLGFIGNWWYAIIVMLITLVISFISTYSVGQWSAKRKKSL